MNSNIYRIKQKMEIKNVERNSVVNMAEIRQFEEEHHITLPEELVLFYTQVCNGCKMIDGFPLRKMEDWEYHAQNLKKEFPFENYWVWEDDYAADKIAHIEDGNIALLDIGDGQSWNIIINGKEKGNMWFFTEVGIQPAAPSMNFLQWFEFWLDGREDYF